MIKKVSVALILSTLLLSSIYGQPAKKEVTITTGIIVEKDINMPLAGAKAILYENNNQISTVITKSDGIVTFTLLPNKDYTIEITKENYVTKRVSINTKIPTYETQQFEIAFSILLFVPCEGLDYSMLQNPVLKVIYNDVKRDFLQDKQYDELMQDKLSQLMKKNQECLDAKFNEVVKKADRLFHEKRYTEARPVYLDASLIRPGNKYVRDQIAEIDRLLALQKDNAKNYKNIIAQADQQFNNKNYSSSKDLYKKAIEIMPTETYPSNQIAKIDSILNKQNQEQKNKKNQEQAFNQLISQGDDAFFDDVCGKSLTAYKKALEIKPNDPEALKKYKEAEAECNKIKANQAAQKDVQQRYQAAIQKGDSLYNAQQYDKAIDAYQQASNILPREKYPQDKINQIKAEMQKQSKTAESQYKNFIKAGDKAFDSEDFASAKTAYQQALTIKPNDQYAKKRLDDINNIIAENQKLEAEKKANQQKYNTIIAQADQAFNSSQFDKATNLYQQALTLIPTETYPKQKLKEIDNIQQQKIAQDENNYKSKIQSGDKNFDTKKYLAALDDYNAALQIKPNDSYAIQQINQINQILTEQKKQEAEQKAKKDNYNNAIAKADQLYKNQQLDDAITAYQLASSFLPDEMYPKNKINEINQLKKQNEQQAAYKNAITNADAAYGKKKYEEAKLFYNQALTIIPNDQYAKDQLAKVEKALNDQIKALADQKARQDAYDKSIADGDNNFSNKNYEIAKSFYQSALAIFPDKTYPAQKIAEIDKILNEINNQKKYESLIQDGDTYFQAQNYDQAKQKYQSASLLKPAETYPKQKLKEIDDIIKQKALENQQHQANERKYKVVIAKADNLFDQAKYDDAMKEYENALAILPDETYPKQRIAKITDIKKMLASESKKTSTPQEKAVQESVLPDLKFNSASERDKYLKELLVKYPAGITCEIYKEKYRQITRYIVIRDNEANDYRKIEYKWGVEYYKNDKPITELYFQSQVRARENEYFVTVEM
jgi:hypothetical protein